MDELDRTLGVMVRLRRYLEGIRENCPLLGPCRWCDEVTDMIVDIDQRFDAHRQAARRERHDHGAP